MVKSSDFGWLGIIRLGLVQTALGAIVVLMTSTLNRVMVVELALPAMLPGALLGLHHAAQALRPRWGYGSDRGSRHTPWIIGGMALLALGGAGAAAAVALFPLHAPLALALAVAAYVALGVGVGASGTNLLVLLAKKTPPARRASAATLVWIMMIAGFVATTAVAGRLLDPFSMTRMLAVCLGVAAIAFLVAVLAVWGVEGQPAAAPARAAPAFKVALIEVWRESEARRLAIFAFVSMLAYASEELILDPFSGAVFGYSVGQSTSLSSALHGGVLVGMLLLAFAKSGWVERFTPFRIGLPMRHWMMIGCLGSALALAGLAAAGLGGPVAPLRQTVMSLGVANGVFSIAAISAMMGLAGSGAPGREGVRMGLWGAAQGVAFGLGGFLGAACSDLARLLIAEPGAAYALVFALQAGLFAAAAKVAAGFAAEAEEGPELQPPILAHAVER